MPERAQVLLVDHDRTLLDATSRLLTTAGHGVDSAGDAHTGLARLQAGTYDLIIADCELPGDDPLALIRNLPPRCAGIPVILLSRSAAIDPAVEAMQLTIVASMSRPLAREPLLAHVAHARELSRARRLIDGSRTRLVSWRDELGRLDMAIRLSPGAIMESARAAWFAVNLEHIRHALIELQAGVETASTCGATPSNEPSADPAACGLAAHERLELLQGLAETLAALEKTKGSIRSQAIGDLRQHLDALFRMPPSVADPAPVGEADPAQV